VKLTERRRPRESLTQPSVAPALYRRPNHPRSTASCGPQPTDEAGWQGRPSPRSRSRLRKPPMCGRGPGRNRPTTRPFGEGVGSTLSPWPCGWQPPVCKRREAEPTTWRQSGPCGRLPFASARIWQRPTLRGRGAHRRGGWAVAPETARRWPHSVDHRVRRGRFTLERHRVSVPDAPPAAFD